MADSQTQEKVLAEAKAIALELLAEERTRLKNALSSAERRNEELVRERDEARSDGALYAKTLMRLRDRLGYAITHAEDEGDRVYFGSSNHYEDLKEVFDTIEALHWDKIMASSQPPVDLYAVIAELRTTVTAAEATIASLTGQVGEMREKAAKVADDIAEGVASGLLRADPILFEMIADSIRALAPSPPGISTTGGGVASGREDDASLATTPAATLDGAERR